jgi:hypothetical protein
MYQDDLDPTSPLARRGVLMQRFTPFDVTTLPGSWVFVGDHQGGPVRFGEEVAIGYLLPVLFEDPSEDPAYPDMIVISKLLMPQGWIHDASAGEPAPGLIPVVNREGIKGVLLYQVNAKVIQADPRDGDLNPDQPA